MTRSKKKAQKITMMVLVAMLVASSLMAAMAFVAPTPAQAAPTMRRGWICYGYICELWPTCWPNTHYMCEDWCVSDPGGFWDCLGYETCQNGC